MESWNAWVRLQKVVLSAYMINFVGLSMCNVWWYHRSRLGQGSSSRVNRGHNVGRGAPVD